MPKFVPRERKHKRIAKQKTPNHAVPQGANAEVIFPTTKDEKEVRRRRLQEDLKAQQPESKLTSKKRKRLDKYIDTKLKKEENLELLKKLAAQKVDTSLLQSAKKLGRVQESKRERFEQALREKNAGVDVSGAQDSILFETRDVNSGPIPGRSDFEDDTKASSNGNEAIASTGYAERIEKSLQQSISFGSGLKRPLETDESGRPVIKKRRRRKLASNISFPIPDPQCLEADEDKDSEADSEWNGFDSDHNSTSDVPNAIDDSDDDSEMISDNESGQSDSSHESSNTTSDRSSRVSAFKAWADSQRNKAAGFTPSVVATNDESIRATFHPRAPSPDAELAEATAAAQEFEPAYRPVTSVVVPRSEEVQSARLSLPVVQDEQKIIEAIHNNPTMVVCGATGSGKTTQLPQMLLENGYASNGMIGVTQPRRVAATAVASRVAFEMGGKFGKQVAHQVRYDSNVGRDTRIKFMTDGILLREISQDFALQKYSAIIIDEAHERSVNTDILIGMLSRIIPLRQELAHEEPDKYHPLKLIIMSATLRVADFLLNDRLFKDLKPPIVQAEGRQYKVIEHFSRRTQRDYVAETVRKVSKGHRKLPPGSILVFLTGQDEIQTVAKRLRDNLATDHTGFKLSARSPRKAKNDYIEYDNEAGSGSEDEIIGFDDDDDVNDSDAEFEVDLDGVMSQSRGGMKAHVLPLYAALPASQQMKVFQPTPEGFRNIILATNVAETSLTIPGVKYVFDCGRSKEKRYDTATGVQEFQIDWISKASALQRMGRAGRTGPGHCYRLYSSAVYEQYFEEHTVPEILRTPIEGTVLQLKNMDVENVVNFPFPTPPQSDQLAHAERLLQNLGAIDARAGSVTDIGKQLIHYPVNPRFGKMLLLGVQNGVQAHAVALVAGLAVGDLFVSGPRAASRSSDISESGSDNSENEAEAKMTARKDLETSNKQKQAYGRAQATLSAWDDKADVVKLLTAVAAHAAAEDKHDFCAKYFLREKGMEEVEQLRRLLHNILQSQIQDGTDVSFITVPPEPKTKDISILKQVVAAGYIDHIAIRADLIPRIVISGRKPARAIDVPYRTLISSVAESDIERAASQQDQERQRNVFVHSSSVLARLSPNEMPPYLVYSNLSRAALNVVGERPKRTRIHPLTTIGPKQLAALAEGTPLLDIGKPIGKIEQSDGGKRRQCWVGVSLRDPNAAGTMGWPLPAWKVVQVKKGTAWTVEKVLDRGK